MRNQQQQRPGFLVGFGGTVLFALGMAGWVVIVAVGTGFLR